MGQAKLPDCKWASEYVPPRARRHDPGSQRREAAWAPERGPVSPCWDAPASGIPGPEAGAPAATRSTPVGGGSVDDNPNQH